MKAIVSSRYGPPDILKLRDIERPVPGDGQVLIRVHASSVTPMDWRFRSGSFPPRIYTGLVRTRFPVLGFDVAGEIEATGPGIRHLKQGDHVYGATPRGGAHAEYVAVSEEEVVPKPENMTSEEAATVPFSGNTALAYLRNLGGIQSGHEVLINGASGGTGIFAVQLAKHFGASVTGVCSTTNLDMVRSLGADEMIDYTKEDFTASGRQYDIVFDAVGKTSFSRCKQLLRAHGTYMATVATVPLLLQMLWTSRFGERKAKFTLPGRSRQGLLFLKELVEAGKMRTVIDRTYPLSEVADAHRYMEKGHAKGKVAVTVHRERDLHPENGANRRDSFPE
ncbi:MAG: NAD(P)-dependent alcohol dehydrogenase [Dehalococcoidia bacterium]|nr:NAD(P)-dependent alcohol dehydrogenase [Dehalococcoidia bacterium]